MSARVTSAGAVRDLAAEVAFLTRALKAPTLRESVPRLAERARGEGIRGVARLAGLTARSPVGRRTTKCAAWLCQSDLDLAHIS